MIEDLDTLIESNSYVSKRVRCLSDTIETEGSQGSDSYLMLIMTKANSDILDKLKEDHMAQEKVGNSCSSSTSKEDDDQKPRAV
jgi:hypothetical protein